MVKYTSSNTVSRAEQILSKELRGQIAPQVTPRMAKGVSQYRRAILEDEVENGVYREQGSILRRDEDNFNKPTPAGFVSYLSKKAQTSPVSSSSSSSNSNSSSGGWRGNTDTVRQMTEMYSPLWLNSNLSLPRDRPTINAWSRSFFALNPIVHNAITLHSTYPIAKLNIKCKHKNVERFFNEMMEEIDLMNICAQVAQEYWVLGEAFVYADLNESTGKWSRLTILNPDYVNVQRSVIASDPILSLRPDENLRRVVFGNKPSDVQQRKQLTPSVIEHVRKNENIPLNNFYVSHIARRISPYENRGTGLIVSCFRSLIYYDKSLECKFVQADSMINPLTLVKIGDADFRPNQVDLDQYREVFECHDDETEVLTSEGFKKFNEVIDYENSSRYGKIFSMPKPGVKIACFNSENEQLEYHQPSTSFVGNYEGEMYHYINKKVDIRVTPDHDMWISEKIPQKKNGKILWEPFKKVKAKDVSLSDYKKLRTQINWEGVDVEKVNVCGVDIDIDLYLEFLGYLLSEGCLYTNNKYQNTVSYSQKKFINQFKLCFEKFSEAFGKSHHQRINKIGAWNGVLCSKPLYDYFMNEIGFNGNSKSQFKQMPSWIKNLPKHRLEVFIKALVLGDGSNVLTKNNSRHYAYHSSSKQLTDSMCEIVYKCGYAPIVSFHDDERLIKRGKRNRMYKTSWSETTNGLFPKIYKNTRNSHTKEKHNTFYKEYYNGKVWCFTVPTGLFVTRRNGKITIQGNSAANDKNFKIFTHNAVTVEPVGMGGAIYDDATNLERTIKSIYIGLMVPSVIMDGSDTTYATGSIALDVLRQRYMQFRNYLSAWLKRNIFAPIAQINKFYEYVEGEQRLIVPEIDWNHMSLFDMDSYINNLLQLTQGEGPAKRASVHTLYRSMGLDYEEEQRRMRYEDIQNAIRQREVASLARYSLHQLKSLGPGDEIEEITSKNEPVPGESPYEGSSGGMESSSAGGLGQMPGSPPPGPIGSGPAGMGGSPSMPSI